MPRLGRADLLLPDDNSDFARLHDLYNSLLFTLQPITKSYSKTSILIGQPDSNLWRKFQADRSSDKLNTLYVVLNFYSATADKETTISFSHPHY